MSQIRYHRNPDGSFVSVESRADGTEYVTDLDLAALRRGGGGMIQDRAGEWQLVKNMGEHARVRQLDSHRDFINKQVSEHGYAYGGEFSQAKTMEEIGEIAKKVSEEEERMALAEAKQRARRAEAYKDLVMQTFVLGRVEPTMSEIRVTDEQYENMRLEYEKASTEWKSKEDRLRYEDEGYFVPLVTYHHKLVNPRTGKQVRGVVKGEVGMMGARIVVLEQGYGTGNFAAVSEKVGGK